MSRIVFCAPKLSLIALYAPNWPTRPLVPIPAPVAVFVILKTQVEIGPRIAPASVGARRICGRFIMFPNWSILVPTP